MANFSPHPPAQGSVPGAEGAPQSGAELDRKVREGTDTGGHPAEKGGGRQLGKGPWRRRG